MKGQQQLYTGNCANGLDSMMQMNGFSTNQKMCQEKSYWDFSTNTIQAKRMNEIILNKKKNGLKNCGGNCGGRLQSEMKDFRNIRVEKDMECQNYAQDSQCWNYVKTLELRLEILSM